MPKRDIYDTEVTDDGAKSCKKIRVCISTCSPRLLLEDKRSAEMSQVVSAHIFNSSYYHPISNSAISTSNAIIPYVPPSEAIQSALIFRELINKREENVNTRLFEEIERPETFMDLEDK